MASSHPLVQTFYLSTFLDRQAQRDQVGLNAYTISAFALASTAVGAVVEHNDVTLTLGLHTMVPV